MFWLFIKYVCAVLVMADQPIDIKQFCGIWVDVDEI